MAGVGGGIWKVCDYNLEAVWVSKSRLVPDSTFLGPNHYWMLKASLQTIGNYEQQAFMLHFWMHSETESL
jgi:hypothetical protein